jgi:NAD-dependent dihydropyrimidine dehydrogenase PreA subunit
MPVTETTDQAGTLETGLDQNQPSEDETSEVNHSAVATRKRSKTWGEVRVFGRWCKGCGLCVAFCPTGVFEAGDDGHPRVRFPDRCTGCEWCEFHCPDMAIDVIRHTAKQNGC